MYKLTYKKDRSKYQSPSFTDSHESIQSIAMITRYVIVVRILMLPDYIGIASFKHHIYSDDKDSVRMNMIDDFVIFASNR